MFDEYIQRRERLRSLIQDTYPDRAGSIVLFAAFEQERYAFRQDSTFFYFTGLEEPGCALVIDTSGSSVLWVPQYGSARSAWVSTIVEANKEDAAQWGIDDVRHLGHPCKGFTTSAACTRKENEHLLEGLEALVKKGEALFMVYAPDKVTEQTMYIDRLCAERPLLKEALVDISPLVGSLRRTKSRHELELMYEAIDCTMQAQEAAASRIESGRYEYQIQAAAEFIMKENGGTPAFPTIVGSGDKSTILHYTQNDGQLQQGDLVVIDCGTSIGYYCADLTRTYPVSGTFTDRQREVYDIVLAALHYIEEQAQPGYWLHNPHEKERSLHHLAYEFIEGKGYAQYFLHSIGHFLGLDVHDVGREFGPLQAGDVIALEPGLYIPKERLGVRIEDNYWITKSGAVCISDELPRDSYEIEKFMRGELVGTLE